MGLLEDDSEWRYCLGEIVLCGSAKQLRSAFAVILQYCRPTEPKKLLEQFLEGMKDDFVYQALKDSNCTRDGLDDSKIFNLVLLDLDAELSQMGGSLGDFKDMPQPIELSEEEKEARVIKEEMFDITKQERVVETWLPLLNCAQLEFFKFSGILNK